MTRPCFDKHKSIYETIVCMYDEFELLLLQYYKCLINKICYKRVCCEAVKSKHKLKKCLEQLIKKIINDNGPIPLSITRLLSQNTNYNVLISDEIIEISNTVEINVNLLPAPIYKGRELVIIKTSNNTLKIHIVPNGIDGIDGIIGNDVYLNDQYQRITLLSNGTNIYYIL